MAKKNYYAVRVGRDGPAIYRTWDECSSVVSGHPGAQFRGFATHAEAQQYLSGHLQSQPLLSPVVPVLVQQQPPPLPLPAQLSLKLPPPPLPAPPLPAPPSQSVAQELSASQRACIEKKRLDAQQRLRSLRTGDLHVLSDDLFNHICSFLAPLTQRPRLRLNKHLRQRLSSGAPCSLQYRGRQNHPELRLTFSAARVMIIHIAQLPDRDRFDKLKTCVRSLPGRTWDTTTHSWRVPFNRPLFDLGLVHRKLGNVDLCCEALDRMLLEEEASLQREEAERAAVLRHAALCQAMTELRQLVAAHAEEPQKLVGAIGAARLAGARDSLLEEATAELRRRAAAHLSAMVAAADTMVHAAARMPEQATTQSVDVRSKLDLLQAAVASARQAGVSEHARMDNVADAENLAEAAADAVRRSVTHSPLTHSLARGRLATSSLAHPILMHPTRR